MMRIIFMIINTNLGTFFEITKYNASYILKEL